MRIELAPCNPDWPRLFDEEKAFFAARLPSGTCIEHMGSTAVPGLVAKPIIDVLIGLSDFALADGLVAPMQSWGYVYAPHHEAQFPERRLFGRRDAAGKSTHHLHMVEAGGAFWKRHLGFRDYLRAHPETAARYAALKSELAARDWDSSNDYALAKGDFVRSIEALFA